MSRIIEEMYELQRGFYRAGAIDEKRMQEHEARYRAHREAEITGDKIRELRQRLDMTQDALAAAIQTSVKTVQAWEAGKRKPNGTASLLLDLLDRKGVEVLS